MLNSNKFVDTSAYLWDYYFKARVPNLQSTSVDYLRMYGTYITGDKGIDQTLASQWTTTMMNISTMIDYYGQGVMIKIVSEPDIKTIYEYISNHLTAWKDRLERGINIGDAPIEDLITMDRFANDVYEHAKYQFTGELMSSMLARQLGSVTRVNKQTFLSGGPLAKLNDAGNTDIVRINQNENEHPERDSLSGFLKSRLVGMKRW